jgi:hypothetical protein
MDPVTRTESSDLQLQRIVGNSIGRQYITHELIAGRLTFHEAIARFRIFSMHNPDYSWSLFQAAHPGTTNDERFGHQVIAYVKSELSDQPDLAGEMVTRLQGQLYSAQSPLPPPLAR